MKRIYKSGAQKRKEAASSRQSAAKLTKLTRFFSVAQTDRPSEDTPAEDTTGQQHPKSIRPAPENPEDFGISEQERPSGSSSTANMERQNESTRRVGVASQTSDLFSQPFSILFRMTQLAGQISYQMHSGVTSSIEGLNKLT